MHILFRQVVDETAPPRLLRASPRLLSEYQFPIVLSPPLPPVLHLALSRRPFQHPHT